MLCAGDLTGRGRGGHAEVGRFMARMIWRGVVGGFERGYCVLIERGVGGKAEEVRRGLGI